MTPDERRSLAEQILSNPLFEAVFDELEKAATERLIAEKNEQDFVRAQERVLQTRAFRKELSKALNNPKPRRGAPA